MPDAGRADGPLVSFEQEGAAADLVPSEGDLDRLADAAADCTACHLHVNATQTVFGAGPPRARLIAVGEQPGDREDREGAPFVGPAGRVWRTRRIHETPTNMEIDACLPWLRAEVRRIDPDVILALGATAAKAVVGKDVRVTRDRGTLYAGPGMIVTCTVHPSSVVRSPDDEQRRAARADFEDDLRALALLLQSGLGAALRERTRRQLYERARALGIDGRSTMDKAALADAVARELQEIVDDAPVALAG